MRNLTISKTFDDFALDTTRIDFDIEDLVSYCEAVTNVLYWINIESVWGPIGFEWDQYDNYGHFHPNPIKFSILPRVPDPHRVKSFYGMFSELYDDITIQENDFVNVNTICNWGDVRTVYYSYRQPGSRIVKYIASEDHGITVIGQSDVNPETLHFIGSLENVTGIKEIPRLIIDNDNVHKLNFPAFQVLGGETYTGQYQYDYVILVTDKDNSCYRNDLTEVIKPIPDDYVYTNTRNRYIICIYYDSNPDKNFPPPEYPYVLKLYEANTTTGSCLTPFILGYNDQRGSIIFDLNGNQDKDLHMMGPQPRRGLDIQFTEEPVHNYCRFCNMEFDTWDFTKGRDQKYNYFVNPHTPGQYSFYNNSYEIGTLQNPYCYCFGNINPTGPMKFDVNYGVYRKNLESVHFCEDMKYAYSLDDITCPVLDLWESGQSTESFVKDFIENSKSSDVIKVKTSSEGTEYRFIMNDINYLDYEGIEQDILPNINYFEFNYEVGQIYLNDTTNKFKGVRTGNHILVNDIKSDSIRFLIVPLECTHKIYPVDGKLSIPTTLLLSTNIPKIFDYPELNYPISDPDNYEHNSSISKNIRFYPFTKINTGQSVRFSPSIPGINASGIPNSGIYITIAQDIILTGYSMGGQDIYLAATTREIYSNQWQIMSNNHLPIIIPLSKILAFDYGDYNFAYTRFFIDEGPDNTEEKAEHMTEFVNKCMRNPSYLGQKDKGEITLNSKQYKLITAEQIDSLIQYGWAVTELKI